MRWEAEGQAEVVWCSCARASHRLGWRGVLRRSPLARPADLLAGGHWVSVS